MYRFNHHHLILNGYLFEIIFRIGFLIVERKKMKFKFKISIFKIFLSRNNSKLSVFENDYFDCIKAILTWFFLFKKVCSLIENENWNEKSLFEMVFKSLMVSLIVVYDCCICVYWMYWNYFRCWFSFELIAK